MQHGVTGLMVRGNDVRSLHDAMMQLMSPTLRLQLGYQARVFAEANRVDEPFTAVLDSEAYRRQLRKRKRMQEKLDSKESQAAPHAKSFAVALSPEAANQQYDVERRLIVERAAAQL